MNIYELNLTDCNYIGIKEIESLLISTALMLEIIWLFGGVRSKVFSHSSGEVV